MSRHRAAAIASSLIALVTIFAHSPEAQGPPSAAPATPIVQQRVRDRLAHDGRARVIVELKLPTGRHVPEGRLGSRDAVLQQRQAIGSARGRLLSMLSRTDHRLVRQFQSVPYVALEVGPAALAKLEAALNDVVRVMEDTIVRPVLADSVPLIQGDQVWAAGYDGSGTVVAILDSGVDGSHPFLAGKVVEEACYSTTDPGIAQTACPNGQDEQLGPGSAVPCSLDSCFHGTHVAGIATGNGDNAGQTFSGVAKNAKIMAVQVFSEVVDATTCGGTAPCMGGYTSDIIAGLERVYAVASSAQQNIVAVNMSLGGGSFTAQCDTEPYKPAIDNLRSIGIASVIASGNDYSGTSMASPACISSAVSVGSTTKTDTVSYFSNVTPFLSLFAPGQSINSSVPGGGYAVESGTSMAAPHVAGAWALIRQAVPGGSVDAILNALRTTGLPITDNRVLLAPGTTTVPRVRVFQALASLTSVNSPVPSIATVAPARVRAGASATLTVTGSGFNGLSQLQWNGMSRSTTVANTSKLTAVIPAADLPGAGTGQVTVFNPAPGGGTSSSVSVPIDPPVVLAVSATTVGPGATETVTLTNGYGGAKDWLALAAKSAPNGTYVQWVYVGAGVTSRQWTVTMPTTGGAYEFRLFLNDGYTRASTSPTVTVDPSIKPAPVVSSISPASAFTGGASFTLTVNGSSFVTSSVVQWDGAPRATAFVSSTTLTTTITAAEIATAGTKQVTVVTPGPGGGTSSSFPFAINQAPTLAISAANVLGGASETVTLTNGLGGAQDWLALAATSAPNTSYLKWVYVGAGVTSRTWTVAMPTTVGAYEFRLFLNNGYTRAATSPTIAVSNAVPAATSLSPSRAVVGGAAFTLTVGGTGFASTSVVRWSGADRPTTYASPTQLKASISASDIASVGSATVTVFSPAPGGGLSSALTFTVQPPPALAISAATVARGGSETVTLTNGLGGASDWIALAATGAGSNSYLRWTYVGTNVTTRNWTVTMPTTPGTYEFRLFLNNSYTIMTTSPPITVN